MEPATLAYRAEARAYDGGVMNSFVQVMPLGRWEVVGEYFAGGR